MTETFDHIVVGGGSSGCVAAAQLVKTNKTHKLEEGLADPLLEGPK